MATQFLDRLPIELVNKDFAIDHWNHTVYQEVEKLVAHMLTDVSVKLFYQAINDGSMPEDRLVEMEGIVAGVNAVAERNKEGPSPVTVPKLIAVNFGFDVITARVFSGHFLGADLKDMASSLGLSVLASDAFHAKLAALGASPSALFREPAFCDAVGFRGEFTASGSGAYFGRSLQFSTANTLQDVVTVIVYAPSPESNKRAVVVATAPGMVGALAGLNSDGVAMGVDTIRAPNSNPEKIGLNSLLMIRSTLEHATDLASAVDYVVDAHRGAAFLYPMCDASGDCAVLESGAWLPTGTPDDPLQYVDRKLKDAGLVPDAAFIKDHPLPPNVFRNGLYVRTMNYTDADLMAPFLKFNQGLFEYAKVPYNASLFDLGQFLFPTWQADDAAEHTLRNNFFYPQQEQEKDFITLSNFAVTPYARLNMMAPIDDDVAPTGESMFWRYDMLIRNSFANKGAIDLDKTQWIMEFLSPERAPGYWQNRLWPHDVGSTIVEGSLTVYDLQQRIIRSKSGYWADGWVELHLNAYL